MRSSSGKRALRILHLEDNPLDRELIQNRLLRQGAACTFFNAANEAEFLRGLEAGADVILSDFDLPGYGGIAALESARKLRPDVPFLFVSGAIGEDRAVETLKAGACDYVLKDRLDRLASAMERAVTEARRSAEHRQLELEARQAQKMEAVGQFACGIAHDFNNVLAVIQMQASLLRADAELPPKFAAGIAVVIGAAERAANLTRQLLAFSHRSLKEPAEIDPKKLVAETLKLLRQIVGENIRFEARFAPLLPAIHADPAMIEQVVMNLVINARDAMPKGGQLIVSLDVVDAGASRVAAHPGVQPGRFLQLGVADTGGGIRQENLERIFEPFFTTKGPGLGTGLGLASVFRIVAQHHGWLEVDSEINVGTTFRIFLPALDGQVSADAKVARGAEAAKGERILVLEDDASVRSLVRAVLERYGYRVFEAATAAAARQIWQEQLGDFDLLFTDLILPGGMSGSELAERLRLAKPDLRVVYTSGYGGEIVAENLSVEASQALLKKPFSAEQLAVVVRKSLDERSNHTP